MPINLRTIISSIESSARRVNSSTPLSELKRLTTKASRIDKTISIYDSAGVMPVDSAFVGVLFPTSTGELYSLDSANGSWQVVVGTPGPEPYVSREAFQGSSFGYLSGGQTPAAPYDLITKFSFTSDGNSTDVGALSLGRRLGPSGHSSSVSGYTAGGFAPPNSNVIDKFPFASDGNATDVGDLTVARREIAGHATGDYGYSSGGLSYTNIIEKFPFATDANATDVGDLTSARQRAAGQSSSDYGYSSGGQLPITTMINNIEKFPFASDGNATDVGDLTVARGGVTGQSSTNNGYSTGGNNGPIPAYNTIDKFPFASDANATDVGDLVSARVDAAGQSSTTHGYTSGGLTNPPADNAKIDKFTFASDANATFVGNLTSSNLGGGAGQQI